MNTYPEPPELVEYRNALSDPRLDEMFLQQIRDTIRTYEAGQPRPPYTCPACRNQILTRPTKDLCNIRNAVDSIARLPTHADGMIEERPRRDDNVWDRFFHRM